MEQYTLLRHLAGTSNAHLPNSDEVIGVASEESLTVSRPGEAGHLGRLRAGRARHLGPQILHKVLALEVPDLDGGAGGGTQPVPVGGEGQAVDGVGAVQGVKVLPIVQVPEHGAGVLAAAGAERPVRRKGDGVKISSVTNVVGLQLAVGQVPDLDVLVPPGGHDDGVGGVRGEPDTADPVRVALVTDGVLALGKGVPKLDGLVTADTM